MYGTDRQITKGEAVADKGTAVIEELLDDLGDCGFEIINVGTRFRVTSPEGGKPAFVPHRIPRNGSVAKVVEGLARIGYDITKADARREEKRQARLAADRERGQRALQVAATEAKQRAATQNGTAPKEVVRFVAPAEAPALPTTSEQFTETVVMDLAMASGLLRSNRFYDEGSTRAGKCNRKFRPWLAREYAARMLRGEWTLNHQGIGFDTDPSLLDGQHRLAGVVIAATSGVPEQGLPADPDIKIPMQITYGMSPAAVDTVDSGLKRSNSDVLAMNGETNTLVLAGTLRLVILYDTLVRPYGRDVPFEDRAWRSHRMSNEQYRRTLDEQPEIRDAVSEAGNLRNVMLTSAACAGTHLIRRSWEAYQAEPFLQGLAHGINLQQGSPVWAARETFLMQKGNRKYKRTAHEHLALLIKAWNLHIRGQGRSRLVWRADEAFPYLLTPSDLSGKPRAASG